MQDDEFEWDDNKAAANLRDHRIGFEVARQAFDDLFADRRKRYGEERCVLSGVVQERLLAVTYTPRGDRVRIISARAAEPFERQLYHETHRHRRAVRWERR
jgi:uncharacterized DUF497 family protein